MKIVTSGLLLHGMLMLVQMGNCAKCSIKGYRSNIGQIGGIKNRGFICGQ